jgi:phospholipase/carboxylesterase
MKKLRLGDLNVWATGGEDREGGGTGPAIVLCHGFGAPGDDLVSLARVVEVDRATRWFFPEAPLEMDFGMGATGRAWWPIDMERMMTAASAGLVTALANETPEGLKKARAALEGVLDALEASHDVRRDRTILGGFSQGGMIATEVALFSHPRPFAGLAVLSGALISQDRWEEAAERSGASIIAIQSHGKRDPILPFGSGEALRDMLTKHGAKVTFVPHNGVHEIPPAALVALATLARERLSGA